MGDLRQIRRRAHALLEGLGSNPGEVAESLHAAGVQGVPRSNSSCAIAVYTAALLKTDPRIRSVAVGPCSLVLTLVSPDDARPAGRLAVQLPKAVRGFVTGFDDQQYPEVIRLQVPVSGPDPVSDPDPDPEAAPTPVA